MSAGSTYGWTGASPIGANLSDRLSETEGEEGGVGEKGDTGEASSPLHIGMVPDDPPTCSGELASPVYSTRAKALKFALMVAETQVPRY